MCNWKRRSGEVSGRKGKLQTLTKSERETELFCSVVNYLPGLFVKLWNEAIKSFARWKAVTFVSSHVGNRVNRIGCQQGSSNLSVEIIHVQTLGKRTTSFVTFLFRPFLLSQIPLGLQNFQEKKLLMYGTIIVQGKWKSRRNGVETVRC